MDKNTKLPTPPQFDFSKYVNAQTEPSRLVGTISAVIFAGFLILMQMGVAFDPNLPNTIIYFVMAVGALVPMVQAEFTRAKVTPNAKVEAAMKAAYEAGKAGEPEPTLMDVTAPKQERVSEN